jgi:hypothetical protein
VTDGFAIAKGDTLNNQFVLKSRRGQFNYSTKKNVIFRFHVVPLFLYFSFDACCSHLLRPSQPVDFRDMANGCVIYNHLRVVYSDLLGIMECMTHASMKLRSTLVISLCFVCLFQFQPVFLNPKASKNDLPQEMFEMVRESQENDIDSSVEMDEYFSDA